jgi:hypothetical protein
MGHDKRRGYKSEILKLSRESNPVRFSTVFFRRVFFKGGGGVDRI